MTGRWLSIVGIGEDGVEGLTHAAREAVARAGAVFGGRRHLALAAALIEGEARTWPSPMADAIPDILARRGERTAVLASGDPYWFGVGATLARHVPPEETACFPAPSAISLACARLGWSVGETAIVSLCGRDPALLLPALQPGARVLVLSEDASTPALVASLLREHGFGPSRVVVLEALGGPDEAVRAFEAHGFPLVDPHPMNVVAIAVAAEAEARVIPLSAGLPDAMFEHDGQLTKGEIRAATLARLSPRQGELLWDVGCGSGSVGIEWMLRHPANRAIGIEAREDRAARARRNARQLGVPGLEVRLGRAPDALAGLPAPDAVFIGGGKALPAVIEASWRVLRPEGRLVVNGITVETEAVLIDAWQRRGGGLTRLSVSRLDSVGSVHAFRPAMTVTQWAATRGRSP